MLKLKDIINVLENGTQVITAFNQCFHMSESLLKDYGESEVQHIYSTDYGQGVIVKIKGYTE